MRTGADANSLRTLRPGEYGPGLCTFEFVFSVAPCFRNGRGEMACLVRPMPFSGLSRQSPVLTEPLSKSDYASGVLVDPQRSLSVLLGILDTGVRPGFELAQPRMLA